jgi:CHAT domain-containing protein
MKLFQFCLKIGFSISLFFIFIAPGKAQVGNQSDVTGPIPIPGDTNPGNNQSDITGPNPIPGDTNPDSDNPTPDDDNQTGSNSGNNPTPDGDNSPGVANPIPGDTNPGGNNPPINTPPTSGNQTGNNNSNSGNQTGNNNSNSGNRTGNNNSNSGNRTGNNNSNSGNRTENNTGINNRTPSVSDRTGNNNSNSGDRTENNTSTETESTEENPQAETEQEDNPQAEQEQEETAEETEQEEEETAEQESQPEETVAVDRNAYDTQLQQADSMQAVQLQEEFQAVEIQNYLEIKLYGNNPPPEQIAASLSDLNQITGKKSALVYISAVEEEIIIFIVFPNASQTASNSSNNHQSQTSRHAKENKLAQQTEFTVLRKISIPRSQLLNTVKEFQGEIRDEFKVGEKGYLQSSQQLYQWIMAPIEDQLKANEIDILVFTLDNGLRGLPIAALHDGQQFLIEKYALAIVPSFGLTDIGYVDVRNSPILAMGASEFSDKVPLPAVPIELQTVIENPRQGEKFLNQEFTITNFRNQNRSKAFAIIHLGTHAEFKPGDRNQSYIEFFDNRLSMSQLVQLSDELGWSSSTTYPVELLVLSACQTALGDRDAELGFAGLAVAAGVKSVLASLWNVSDLGTLGLMGQFYQEYGQSANKAEALRQAQLAMLRGQVRVENGKMILENGETIALPPEFPKGTLDLSHPYYWSSFTLIGNWN